MPKNDIESVQKTFYYHADANAIGGTVNRPFHGSVPSHASISLPLVGGFLRKQRKGREWKGQNIVSYTSESTSVSGSQEDPEKDGPWTTEVSASIEGLKILEGVIEADRVVAQLSIAHPHSGEEPTISLLGSQFENLRISGVKVKPVVRYDLFSEHDGTLKDSKYPSISWPKQPSLLKKVREQKKLAIKTYSEKYETEPIPNWIHHHFHEFGLNLRETAKDVLGKLQENPVLGLENDKDYIVCSLVDHLPGLENFPGVVCGNGIYLPGYGRFYFGEVIVQQGTYRVSMIRAQLGSPVGAAMSVGVASSNGKPGGP
jgi:hypothetical protein